MSDRERKRAFAVAATVVMAVAVALTLIGPPGEDDPIEPRAPARAPRTVIESVAERPQPVIEESGPEARVRAFAVAYLRYEVGDLSKPVVRALRENASPILATRLLAAPPSPPAGRSAPAPGRIVDLRTASVSDGERAVFEATIDYDGVPSVVRLAVRRSSQGWRVGSLR